MVRRLPQAMVCLERQLNGSGLPECKLAEPNMVVAWRNGNTLVSISRAKKWPDWSAEAVKPAKLPMTSRSGSIHLLPQLDRPGDDLGNPSRLSGREYFVVA